MSEHLYIDFNIMHQNADVESHGTYFQAKFNASYYQLVDTFGLPERRDYIEVEWSFNYGNGVIATIYNKNKGIAVENITEWHIGGYDFRAVQCVMQSIKDKLEWNSKQYDEQLKLHVQTELNKIERRTINEHK